MFISALIFPGGKPFQFLELAREGKINLTVSEAILDEISGVLAKKFNWLPEDIADGAEMDYQHGAHGQASRTRQSGAVGIFSGKIRHTEFRFCT